VIQLLRERGAGDVVVFGGGIIPDEDIPGLCESGVAAVFTPGASTDDIIAWVKDNIHSRGADES